MVRCDPMTPKERRAIRSRVRKRIAPHAGEIERRGPGVCVATGGTVGALARLVATRRSSWPTRSVSQLFVTTDELHELTAELVASSHEQRLRMPGIQKPRADLLPAGAVILESAVAELGLDGFTVSDWGLREGVILESLGLVPAPGVRPTVQEVESKPRSRDRAAPDRS
jgi:exopolyphosphatase/guanosine-5'-triphosphate,3'-diphosphate pyrophosphatase